MVIEIGRARSDRNAAEFYSLIAEGGVKSRDLSCEAWLWARSDRNAAQFYGYPYFTFYLEEIFCAHLFPFFFFVLN